MIILTCLIHLSVFFSFLELEVNLILKKIKLKLCWRVFVIYANDCGACLAECFHFISNVVKYHKQMEELLKSEICQYIIEETLTN